MEISEFRFYGGSRACFIEWGEDVTSNGGMRCCFVNDGWCIKGFFWNNKMMSDLFKKNGQYKIILNISFTFVYNYFTTIKFTYIW